MKTWSICFCILIAWGAISLPAVGQERKLQLANHKLQVEWTSSPEGWKISSLRFFKDNLWQQVGRPSGEYTLLYSATNPYNASPTTFKTAAGTAWPDTLYSYLTNRWAEASNTVALNTAGEAHYFYPSGAKKLNNNTILFTYHSPLATITTEWSLDEKFEGDMHVNLALQTNKDGYYSLSSPSIAVIDENDRSWATMPGYFQGRRIEHNTVLSYGYGQGVPELPVLFRERTTSTLSPIITTKKNISFATIPDPGLGRDPWESDHNTHQNWFVALSHKNRKAQLSPTLYYPVLGEPLSAAKEGSSFHFGFRYSFVGGKWDQLLEHAINDVYAFDKALALRKNSQSLTSRMEHMHRYLTDRQTSMWNIEDYKGMKIGGQSYLGGVVGSQKDAVKNADYGAMWMLATTSLDPYLKDSVLPYALNFKLAQQQTDTGFFMGAATGQYYLTKRKTFTEEWGEFVEPISLTYYVMLDIGNILLFEPGNNALKERLALGAARLLDWQKSDGSWDVAYDRHTHQPLFTDLKDLRPTFYGLLVAYRILKDPKYLVAAKKGADWFISNAVENGAFIGVCGDSRYAPDFATGQSAQALLDLYDFTKEKKYQEAAIRAAEIYLSSIYTHPVPSSKKKKVNGVEREDWQITQAGLSFEHGGILGSANVAGPIALCSHAGLFVRMFHLTGNRLFIEMARAAAIGRDAFVDSKTSVASYYWNAMNKGAGPYPHHAWWQIGWITDYLMAEAQYRSYNHIVFPRGFVTPKVGPHQSYGFAPGKIYGHDAYLMNREGLIICDNPNIEYIVAANKDGKKTFLVLLNDIGTPSAASLQFNWQMAGIDSSARKTAMDLVSNISHQTGAGLKVQLKGHGILVYMIQ